MPLLYKISNWDFVERDLLSTLTGWEDMTQEDKEILKAVCENVSEQAKQRNKNISLSFTVEGKILPAVAKQEHEHERLQPNEMLRLTFRPNGEILADCDQSFRQQTKHRTR